MAALMRSLFAFCSVTSVLAHQLIGVAQATNRALGILSK